MSVTTRTITVRVDGDATKANKALNSVGDHAGLLSKKILKVGGLIAAAFSVTKIIQFGKESVRAMMEDQKSAALLAKTLKNVTHARTQDIAAVEDYIKKTTLATGVADDELRPSFAKIVRATKDTTKAQRGLNLALNISSATGKNLDSVATALSKAYLGNFTALTRLGVPIDKATLKSKDLNKILAILERTFSGSMEASAKTLAGRMQILKNAFNEMKEDVGYALLPSLEKFASWMAGPGLKAISAFFGALTGKGNGGAARDPKARVADWEEKADPLTESAVKLGDALRGLVKTLADLFKSFDNNKQSGLVGFVNLMTTLLNILNAVAKAIGAVTKSVVGASNKQTGGKGWWNDMLYWVNQHGPNPAKSREEWWAKASGKNAIGGTIPAGSTRLVGERGPELWTPSTNGRIFPNNALGSTASGLTVNVNVAGSVIRERDLASSVRDQIAQLMRRRGADPSILGV